LGRSKYGESIPTEIISEAAERIENLYGVGKARAMRLANRALNTYEAKGGWVDDIDEEIESILKVVVSVWIEKGIDDDARDSWFEGDILVVGDKRLSMEYPIQDLIEHEEFVIVLYAYDSYQGAGQFSNLVAVDKDGEEIWKAEHPTSDHVSAYVKLLKRDPLVAWNFAGYRCTINPDSGEIIEAVFEK
jgi:hypothetical protein